MTVGCDRSELLALQQALESSADAAAIGSLVGSFAHGSNNHLTVILSCLDMLHENSQLDDEGRRIVALAMGAARRLAEGNKALLAAARRQVGDIQTVPLDRSVADAVRIFSLRPGPPITVHGSIPDGLSAKCDPRGLQAALVQAFALGRHREATDVRISATVVEVKSRSRELPMLKAGSYACLELEMTGATFSERLLSPCTEADHVFGRLHEPHGLELAAVEVFASAARGYATAEGRPGTSPVLRLYLPVGA